MTGRTSGGICTTISPARTRVRCIPWLDMFPSRASILRRFEADGPLALGMSPAGGLDIAEMLDAIGRPSDARRTLERYLERPVLRSHAGYLESYLPKIGQGDLVS